MKPKEALEAIRKEFQNRLDFPFNLTPEYRLVKQALTEQEKKDELLELYRELIVNEETYNTSDSLSQKMELVEQLMELRLEIEALEEELK